MGKNVSFLFGSGVSICAGMSSTSEITSRILLGRNIQRRSADFYVISENSIQDPHVKRIVRFLRRIKIELDRSGICRDCNYEDLSFIASQIRDYVVEYPNPIVQPFVDRILPDLFESLQPSNSFQPKWNVHELAGHAVKYIKDVVSALLETGSKAAPYLEFVLDAHKDNAVNQLSVFTLNHDTLLENKLSSANIDYCDGFRLSDGYGNTKVWDPDVFKVASSKIALLKLHGSINWFRYSRKVEEDFMDFFGKADNVNAALPTGCEKYEERPLILVGTINKILEYGTNLFADLQYQFYRNLNKTDILIIVGYGFGDKDINRKLVNWMGAGADRQFVCLDPNAEILTRSPMINRGYIGWKEQNRALHKSCKAEQLNWQDIKKLFV